MRRKWKRDKEKIRREKDGGSLGGSTSVYPTAGRLPPDDAPTAPSLIPLSISTACVHNPKLIREQLTGPRSTQHTEMS